MVTSELSRTLSPTKRIGSPMPPTIEIVVRFESPEDRRSLYPDRPPAASFQPPAQPKSLYPLFTIHYPLAL